MTCVRRRAGEEEGRGRLELIEYCRLLCLLPVLSKRVHVDDQAGY